MLSAARCLVGSPYAPSEPLLDHASQRSTNRLRALNAHPFLKRVPARQVLVSMPDKKCSNDRKVSDGVAGGDSVSEVIEFSAFSCRQSSTCVL